MKVCMKLLEDYFDSAHIGYTKLNDDTFQLEYEGDNIKELIVDIHFSADDTICVFTFPIATFSSAEQYSRGLILCNALKNEYGIDAHLNDAKQLIFLDRGYFTEDTLVDICMNMLENILGIIDNEYLEIMKTVWR